MTSSFHGTDADGLLKTVWGADIGEAVHEAIGLAAFWRREMKFEFRGVTIVVAADSRQELIIRDWWRACGGYIDNTVGPHPKPELSAEELANDARLAAEYRAENEAARVRSRARAEAHQNRVEARMRHAPAMEFSDEAAWLAVKATNERTPLGASVLSYAERWARMMQLELSEGKPLDAVWLETAREADLEGMSAGSQGEAAHLLTQCWAHGAELRRLYNARWGVSSTEDTYNPAIIPLGGNIRE